MEIQNILNAANVNVQKLEKGLKHIGLTLSSFDSVAEEQVSGLIELFKIAVDIDPKTTAKFTKMDLRSKLEKVLKGQRINHNNHIVDTKEATVKEVVANEQIKKPRLNVKLDSKDINAAKKIKLGKVKFFDHRVNNFGIIVGIDDAIECHVSPTNILTPPINDDDIVAYEPVLNRDGKYRAARVSKNIPVFIFNKESSQISYAYPLFDNHLEKEITLTGKYETGFATVRAKYYRASSWKISVVPSENIPKAKSISYGKNIIVNLLPNLNDYKGTIEWLTFLLQTELVESDLDSIYSEVINKLEQKTIPEINKEVKNIKDGSSFKSYFEKKKKSLNKISFVLWALGEIEKLPNAVNQAEVDIWRFDILPSLHWQALQQVITKLFSEQGPTKQVEESYKHLISLGWEITTKDELERVIDFLSSFTIKFPFIGFSEADFKCIINQFYIELYNKGLLKELTDDRIKQCIEEIQSDSDKALFIEKQTPEKILSFYNLFPGLSSYRENYFAGILDAEISKIEFLCFDLESDGENIIEFAWKSRSEVKSEADFKQQEDGITELVWLLNSGTLIIGQNIKEFDLSVLANHGASPSSDCIWDTLEVEMLLNPGRFSYGLKTQHSATSDTELTYRLFKNQLSRIIVLQSSLSAVKELLPAKAIEAINLVGSNPNWDLLDYEYFVKQSNEFFRPNPTNQNISEQTFNQLTQKLKEEGNKVVIAPEFLWNTLSHQFDLTFYSDSKSFGFCLNKNKIEASISDDKLLKAILLRFVDLYTSKGLQPYFQHLPIAIRLKLNGEQATLICDYIEVDFESINHKPICVKPTDIEILKKQKHNFSDLKVIVVGNELYNLTSKLQLGQDLDFATIFDRLKNEPIWLQMSGGKSFIGLEQSHCRQLGITEFPEFIQNIWLEKIGKGKFKVWCNINFDTCINDLPLNEASYIDWVDENFTKTKSFIIRPDARKSGYIAEQKRVNPESLYRKIYWVYQFKLFEGIGNTNNPKVLIVNDESEIEKLSAYARRKGYYIPDTQASLARQVELLHTHRSPNKILIASFLTLDKIISSNYTGPLDFIWDSFLLQEKLQMLKGKIPADFQSKEEQKEDDFQTDVNSIQKDYDLFSLIKLHKPLIDYYYKMLYDNNQDSQLFLCDTRLTDYYGIEKSLNLNAKDVQMWYKEADYDTDKEIAAEFFSSVHENANTDFNIDEAKEILRQIFLIPEEGGIPYPWHDYQHPCLNEILPAKKDLLISLPTGAGKSLLFQGPALFRSAFSCKLSIVISPLRALMQDQVDALWNKGFYSNVEFLSGDKSHVEIRDIYRRISGGEVTLLYITPERFRSRSFENCLLTRLDADSGLEYVVFDEAHCISQWGQEFRPDYLNAGRKVAGYSGIYQMCKLLFSATISEQVFEEISILMPGVVTVEGTEKSYNPVRDHIKMDFKHNVVEDDRLLEVANYLKSGRFNPILSRAIIFVKSRKKVEECSLIMPDSLKDVFGADCGFVDKVGAFHAGMDAEDRKDTYEKYKSGEIVILFATKAFGMGMDIPNIHFVTHYSPPSTFEDFLQEVGRAGRNEKQRLEAGFNSNENPIKTLCLTTNNDFAKLKDQLHQSRISWHEVKDIKQVLEEYIARFKSLIPDTESPVAVPFNLYSNEKGSVNDDLDIKFRISLHWLERLGRIKLGYFTITHLEFDAESLNKLSERIYKCPDKDCEKVCYSIIELLSNDFQSNKVVQLSIASLRGISKLSLENLFTALLKNHSAGILKLLQDVVVEPTKIRLDEINHSKNVYYDNEKYPALQVIFSLASKILGSVPSNGSKFFEGEELDDLLKESVNENIYFIKLPWTKKDNAEAQTKEYKNYIKDIFKKRSKHAFTIIRLLGKTKHETKMEKVSDGNRKIRIKQSVFNGYHKKEEWSNKITQLEKDCIKLLDYVAKQYFDKNIKNFNWPDIISELNLKGNIQYLSDLLFILSVLGYSKTGGLLPTGIEIYLTSVEKVDETDLQSLDKKIFDEFEETRKVRELKLIALEVLAGFQKIGLVNDANAVRKKQDAFIRKYFGCNSLESLLQLLQDELPPNDPLLVKWRGDAIKTEEDRLNDEQRKVYDSEINQHINVMAGPGSGKTHTLTLRVARLVHHIGTKPEEILVLAYNRAVVSELKERLGRLFNDLGYGNLAKRIKIFTFHGLAKRFCQNEIKGQPFDEWERILLGQLNNAPGQIMNQLAPLKHILVDEFQDINNVRIRILNKLHELTDSHIFIIGDPNQSIYGYERIKEGGSMSPWPYYGDFNEIFNPTQFELYDNHRSYPAILNLANQVLTLPEEHQNLILRPTRIPDENFITNYAEVIDRTQQRVDWWDRISILMQERVGQRPYKQIAILFRTNNEVYRGFQKIKGLNLPNIRIRIQGSLPYEFTRIRECHAVIQFLKSKLGQQIPLEFKKIFRVYINDLINQNPNWNHFYIRVIYALVLEYLEEQEESHVFDNLLEFISELTYKDDGQLYKIYEKHLDKISTTTHETEIILTTMHKVKGLEFDSVIIPPSFSNLPLKINDPLMGSELEEQLDEEKRLVFVAYTRARYRLLVFKHFREIALANNTRYVIPENANIGLGIPIQPGIKKLKIGWAAKAFNFNSGVNSYINTSVRSGDFVFVRQKIVPFNGGHFTVYEIVKENTSRPIGELASNANFVNDHQTISGFVVNEVVVWSFDDTCKFDAENGTNYSRDWCPEARRQGYIYLVDFAGFGGAK
ncbi:UvrD-helicase domain-containing protein [Chitinophaga filiformis]|uniref:DNA 3'-5' helicase n=1 Tax=Chitinophaga filiformis TaxID=104663 RepID=A0ABY4I6U1_CHIFI|nr:UvrD-helicase domain-containing protein [Chitinophaga filiformis]UPK70964.1 UvrD-helicase domain-containing protein [Chitinophaga filiformis]